MRDAPASAVRTAQRALEQPSKVNAVLVAIKLAVHPAMALLLAVVLNQRVLRARGLLESAQARAAGPTLDQGDRAEAVL